MAFPRRPHDLHDEGVMEDLVERVWMIVRDAAQEHGMDPNDAHSLAADVKDIFTDLLVNHYGED